jgi:lysophospholipase L1-like esterase
MKYRIELLLKRLVYLIIAILALQVVKVVFNKLNFSYSYFLELCTYALQSLTLLAFLFIPLFQVLLKRFTTVRKIVLIAWLLFIAQVALLEGLCTYWIYHSDQMPGFLKDSYTYFHRTYLQTFFQYDDKAFEYNGKLFYTMKPNISCIFSDPEFKTRVHANSAGFRDDDQSLNGPSVVCIGDSFTFGWGVEQEDAFPQLLEKRTGRKVLNTGIPSYGTAREITSLQEVDRGCLDYILIQYCGNDEGENQSFVQNHFVLNISSKEEYEQIIRGYKINRQYFPAKNFSLLGIIFLKQLINKIHYFFPVEVTTVMADTQAVKQFLDIVAKAPVDFSKTKILVFQLDISASMHSKFAQIADSLCHTPYYQSVFNNNLKAVNLEKLTQSDFFILDGHINAAGHKKVAAIIESEMRSF